MLVCGAGAFPRVLPDGALGRRHPRIAFDFAVINSLGQGHWDRTLVADIHPVEAYADQKGAYQDTARKCSEAGILFQPLVFDSQGAMTPETQVVLHQLATAMSKVEAKDLHACKTELHERIGILVARASSRSIRRRCGRITHAGAAA